MSWNYGSTVGFLVSETMVFTYLKTSPSFFLILDHNIIMIYEPYWYQGI